MAGPTYKALFNKFRDTTVIDRCEQYARWTLPYLMANVFETSSSGRVIVERDFQEIGALFTNNLAAKLTKILFPNQPFFIASANEDFKQHAQKQGVTEDALRAGFAQLEVASNKRLFLNSGYAALILALKHLIVSGNALLYRDSDEGCITTYGLQSFATKRDGSGELLDCILREYTTVEALPEALQAALRAANSSKFSRPEVTVEKYTRIHREYRNGVVGYAVSQQVDSITVGTPSWYPKNLCPWMAPTWVLIPGEHYGRGMVEDYAGGFARLSSFSEAAALYGIEIMKLVHLVGAGSGGDIDELAGSETGEYVRGDPNNIAVHEAGDAGKLQAVAAEIQQVITRLSKAFMYEAMTRDAERVTAYELQRDAQEAEYGLGGVYSTLSGGLQVPLAHLLLVEVSDVALAGIISGDLQPDVTAGIPALGRSSDVQNILMAAQEANAVLPVVQLDKRIDPQRVMDIILSGRSIDTTTIFYTPEEQRQNAEAETAAQNAMQAAGQADALTAAGEQLTGLTGG